MRSVNERRGAVSVTLLQPTEPTTDSLDAVPLVGPTSNHAGVRLFGFMGVTPSTEFKFDAEESTADHLQLRVFRLAAADQAPPRTENVWVNDLGEAGYHVLQSIPVEIRRVGIGDFEASFREANIAISGNDRDDAFQALVAEILETFDVLLGEQNLGPDAAEQRQILRAYIVRA